MIEATVAAPIEALTQEQKASAFSQGGAYARNKVERLAIAEAAARTLTAAPTFDQWEAYRVQWVAGHAEQNPDLTGNAHDAAWAEFARLLDILYGLTKPKSTSVAATKKAQQREQQNQALLDKHADTPVIELRDQLSKTYEAMAKNPDNKDLRKQQKELDKVIKLRTSEENKAHGEELKRLRADAREAVGKCTDIEKLEAVIELLDPDSDMEYVIAD